MRCRQRGLIRNWGGVPFTTGASKAHVVDLLNDKGCVETPVSWNHWMFLVAKKSVLINRSQLQLYQATMINWTMNLYNFKRNCLYICVIYRRIGPNFTTSELVQQYVYSMWQSINLWLRRYTRSSNFNSRFLNIALKPGEIRFDDWLTFMSIMAVSASNNTETAT